MKVVEEHITAKELKEKPDAVFNRLWRTMVPKLYRFALAYVMNFDVAEDMVQHAFMMLWNKMQGLNDGIIVNAWLYTVVKNACLEYYKRLNVEDANRMKLTEALIYTGTSEYDDDSELMEKLQQCLQALPPQQRRVLELKVFKGMSYKEIAEELGVTEFTVQTHIKRAYKFIRESMPMYWGVLLPYLF